MTLYKTLHTFSPGYDFKEGELDGLSTHRIVEAMKFTYAQRMKLEDPIFNPTVNQVFNLGHLSCIS